MTNRTLLEFKDDIVNNRLAQVNWIVAPYKYSEHPEACPTDGAYYINLVMEALTANPEVWSKTVLFLNYDENDGQFDHVVPPMPPLTSEQNKQGMVSKSLLASLGDEILDLDKFPGNKGPLIPDADPGGLQPIGLGPRVPMLILSPWTAGGWVCSQTFDHTSVLQFLEERFEIPEPNISAWRRSICGNLTAAFDFASKPDPSTVRFTVPKLLVSQHLPYHVPAEQSMPGQEEGTRKARPIPYEFFVHCRLHGRKGEAGRVWVDFSNTGGAGAGFYVYNGKRPEDAPRRYTVAAGDAFPDYWLTEEAHGEYDLSVYGPNGYFCHFRGNANASSVEVKVSYDVVKGNVSLSLFNSGSDPCKLTVKNRYGKESPHSYTIAAGSSSEDHWDLSSSAGWFDLSVMMAEDASYLRRFAGHVETGKPSTNDPGVYSEEA